MKAWLKNMIGKTMQNKRLLWWGFLIILTPFVIMLFLHACIAIQQRYKFDFNVQGIAAADWFMFAGSYLGGAMTLLGVVATLKHERNVHRHQQMIESIHKEQDALCNIINGFNVLVPLACDVEITSALNNQGIDQTPDLSEAKRRIMEQMSLLLRNKAELHLQTNMCCASPQCENCKKPCRLPKVKEEFRQTYNTVYNGLYDAYEKLNTFASVIIRNSECDQQIHRITKIISLSKEIGEAAEYTEEDIEKLKGQKRDIEEAQTLSFQALQVVADFDKNEIIQLISLVREYTAILEANAARKCFGKE